MKKFIRCFLPALAGAFLLIAAPAAGQAESNLEQDQSPPSIIRIAAMGDIMLGTENRLPSDGAAGAFAEVSPFLVDCQVVIGNLEGPLTDRGAPTKAVVEGQSYVFRSPPAYVERLRQAGFTVMSLANNHAGDYGPAGRAQTREVLEAAGLLHTGAPSQVARQMVGRTEVSIIGLAPNRGCQNLNNIEAAADLVSREAARPGALVVVVFHGGAEGPGQINVPHGTERYLGENRGDLRRLSRALIDAGAHLVIGHGPHVPRGLEIYRDRLIAYSLGNFATGRGISVAGRTGLAPLLLVEITTEGRLAGGRVLSFQQLEAGRPALDPSGAAVTLMHSAGLADFAAPALDHEGRLMISEIEALALAATSSRAQQAARPTAPPPAVQPDPATETAALTVPQETRVAKKAAEPAPSVRPALQAVEQNAFRGYEWDVYSERSLK